MPSLEIVPYRSDWPAEFTAVAARLRAALGGDALRIDHIGSTSVPGLGAKDIVDVQVTVATLDLPDLEERITAAGFEWHPHLEDDSLLPAGLPATEFEKRVAADRADRPYANVHIRVDGRFNQRFALLFRDYLRAMPDALRAYEQVKRALASRAPEDLDFYYDVKDPVVAIIYLAADEWAKATGWSPGPADA